MMTKQESRGPRDGISSRKHLTKGLAIQNVSIEEPFRPNKEPYVLKHKDIR